MTRSETLRPARAKSRGSQRDYGQCFLTEKASCRRVRSASAPPKLGGETHAERLSNCSHGSMDFTAAIRSGTGGWVSTGGGSESNKSVSNNFRRVFAMKRFGERLFNRVDQRLQDFVAGFHYSTLAARVGRQLTSWNLLDEVGCSSRDGEKGGNRAMPLHSLLPFCHEITHDLIFDTPACAALAALENQARQTAARWHHSGSGRRFEADSFSEVPAPIHL